MFLIFRAYDEMIIHNMTEIGIILQYLKLDDEKVTDSYL